MTDLRLAKKWIKETNAEEVITEKDRLRRIALSLLRAWRRYKKTGCCPWTGQELYDYTYFLHAFANRYAGIDDDLYQWLTDAGLKMLDIIQYPDSVAPNRFCPICGRVLTAANIDKSGNTHGKVWCSTCASTARMKKLIGS